MTVQELIRALQEYWAAHGCIVLPPYDMEVGAGTFTPATFLRSLGPNPHSFAYVAPSRRPTDGRYGENPNRLYKFHQFQVILKPSPLDNQELYLRSLEAIGIDLKQHDIRFVHDDWESPTLGAYGLGWEVWVDGMEATQFTYFQTVGQFKAHPVTVEYAYGIERLAMYAQNVDNVYDLKWNETTTYGDLFLSDEREWGKYHFEFANSQMWMRHFEDFERESIQLLNEGQVQPALDFVMKASHAFNTLDAKGAISVSERAGYIGRIRHLSHRIAKNYIDRLPKVEAEKCPPLKLSSLPSVDKESPFLLELGSEELPASFIPGALNSLKHLFTTLLKENQIAHGDLDLYGSPRRLALTIENLAPTTTPAIEERRGPSVDVAFDTLGIATKAGIGFFKSIGVEPMSRDSLRDSPSDPVKLKEVGGKSYLFATLKKAAIPTAKILQENLPRLISQITFPKKMRWNSFECEYARPLHWIVALFGTEVIPFEFGPVTSGRTSRAHRQRKDNAQIEISHALGYVDLMRENSILVSPAERRAKIEELLAPHNPLASDKVLSEVVHLVEWPDLIIGSFDSDFLEIPHEILICEMEDHQKVFPLQKEGKIDHHFALISDQKPSDGIRSGNERVITARLSDGRFLYNQDLKRSLNAMREDLKAMTFYADLGTMFEKTERLEKHVLTLHQMLSIGSGEVVMEAARYSKADLTSQLVGEFPELQGIAGSKYAAHEKKEAIAAALAEQWLPLGEGGALPQTPEGSLLAIADRLDNLLACFASGRIPTSTKDPYALRRQAIGLLRICFENKIDLQLRPALSALANHMPERPSPQQVDTLINFILGRMEALLIAEGFTKTEIAATIPSPDIALCDLHARLSAVHALKQSADFNSLTEVFKRAAGQVGEETTAEFSDALTAEPAEIALAEALALAENRFEANCDLGDYRAALEALGGLREPLSAFFDAVRVQCDEPKIRQNRLALLARILAMSRTLAHISEI